MKLCVSFVYSKIKKTILDLKISTKITLFYFVLFALTLVISIFFYQRMHYEVMSSKIEQVSKQTLYSINSNFNSIIENVNNYSRMIVANTQVRNILRRDYGKYPQNKPNQISKDLEEMEMYLKQLMYEAPEISSIYLYDNYGDRYFVDKRLLKKINEETQDKTPSGDSSEYDNQKNEKDENNEMWPKNRSRRIDKVSWYNRVVEKNGAYILLLNAGGVFEATPDNNFVSLIRLIRDIDSMEPIGIMVVNIPDKAFIDVYKEIFNEMDTDGAEFVLLDEDNRSIVSNPSMEQSRIDDLISKFSGLEYHSKIISIDKKDYLQSFIRLNRYNWKFISLIPFEQMSNESSDLRLIAMLIIIINGIMLFIGSVAISRMITTPIKKLIKSMKGIEKKDFKMVNVKTGNDEIGKLKDCYNLMVSEIQNLLHQTMEEQRIKRKAELNVLQEQVKPHFLYNTIDALGYLALSGKNEELYEALEALGSYYRTSLSKGKEIITLREEVDIIKAYLTLQKLRYGNIFTVNYGIDKRVYEYKTLKLVLQPLVENSLYHGIKPKGEMGHIEVSIRLENESIVISVEDDGIGMSEEELLALTKDKIDSNSSSFGLKGTIKRLQIFYGVENIYKIESRKRYGTKVTITIPKKRGDYSDRLQTEGYAG